MSLSAQRQELATLLSTLDDLRGHPYRPRTFPPGAAWPLLVSIDREEDLAVRWVVVVVLPSDERKASEWFDEHHGEIAEVLEDSYTVERIEPHSEPTEAGDLNAMLITVRKEA